MKKVFLGGTCNNSIWRDILIPMLKIDYFNPVVAVWDEQAKQNELEARANSDYVLYVITPFMTGVYAIAEVVDDSNKRPHKTIFCYLNEDPSNVKIGELNHKFSTHQIKSLEAIKKMVILNGGQAFNSLEEVANYLNNN
jgi:hypothetical protein